MAPSVRPYTFPPPRLGRRLFALLLSGLAAPASAQVVGGGLNTRVNGSDGGSCQAGTCRVDGGIGAGPNGFYRFRQFDTRQGVDGVSIDNRGRTNVVVGVTHPQGTFLNKPLVLSEAAHLFWVSPGGIWLGRGASFSPVNTLLLSTATSLNLGQGKGFDVLRTTAEEAAGLNGVPDPSQPTIVSVATLNDLGLAAPGPVVLAGGRIQVERSLLIQAPEAAVQAVAGAGSTLKANEKVSLRGQRLDLNDLQLSAGVPGQRGEVTLQTMATPNQDAGRIHLESSSLQGRMVQVLGGSVDLENTTIEAPKGLIRLESTAANGAISLKASHLDLEVHSLADLLATAAQPGGAASERRITPTIHLRSRGDLSISQGSELKASQDLNPLRQDLASRGVPWPDVQAISLVDTSGNAVLEADRAIRIANSQLRADASDNLAGNIALVARGAGPGDGIHLDSTTISARGGAGSGDIRFASAGGITLKNSQLLVESGHAPSMDNLTIDWDNLDPFNGGEITLLNTAQGQPISVDNSRLEALTHTGQGPLFPFLFNPLDPLLEPSPFEDIHDRGDKQQSLVLNPAGNAIGKFPQGRITLVSDGGIQLRNQAVIDAGSHDPGNLSGLESFGGQITLVNRSAVAGLVVQDSSLLNRNDPATAPRFLNPYDSSTTLPLGRPGQTEIWSGSTLMIRNSQVDGGQAGTIQLSSLTPADLQGSNLVRGSDSQLSGISQRSGPAALAATPATGTPDAPITTVDPELARLVSYSRAAGVQPSVQVVILPDNRVVIVTVTAEGKTTIQAEPTRKELAAVLGQEQLAALVDSKRAPPLPSSPPGRMLAPDQLAAAPVVALAQAGTGGPLASNQSSGSRLQQQSTTNAPTTTTVPSLHQAYLNEAEASSNFSQSEQRGQRETLAGLGLTATAAGEVPTTVWLQQQLRAVSLNLGRQLAKPYRPAILRLSLTPGGKGTAALDLLYLPPQGSMQGWRVDVPEARLRSLIARFQQQLSRMEEPDLATANSAASQLSGLLLQPLLPTLQRDGINALLLSVDRGLQAIPYAALPVAPGVLLGDAYALTLTPSLGLTGLASSADPATGKMLLGGSSRFANGLAELPLVRQELQTLAAENSSDLLLDNAFSDRSLLRAAGTNLYRRVHLATHAEFRGGRPTVARLYTASGDLNLSELAKTLREGPSRGRLDLLSLSACRTALGDEQSELGLVGLALRTGSRSALGTLWFVDDAASAAFFVDFYRQLARGLPKDEALRQTRVAFRRGTVRLDGDRLVDADAKPLVAGLSPGDRQRLANGLAHPYFWAGMTLSGSPW
jgi:CHAT domain-containing protein